MNNMLKSEKNRQALSDFKEHLQKVENEMLYKIKEIIKKNDTHKASAILKDIKK